MNDISIAAAIVSCTKKELDVLAPREKDWKMAAVFLL